MTVLLNRMEIAFLSALVALHSVLKWLHHPSLKNVMLRHAVAYSQDFLQAFAFDTFFDDAYRYFSPAPASHTAFVNLSIHVKFPPAHMMILLMLVFGNWHFANAMALVV